jgi:TRAP-type mannitol/chloroaromatic compound transport system permease small subunit
MRANKVVVQITVEVLDINAAPAMIYKAVQAIDDEAHSGEFIQADGDTVSWYVKTVPVTF